VQCCITSPPYYGLRDYGTAQWGGGDANCTHVIAEIRTGLGLAESPASVKGGGHKAKDIDKLLARNICPKCGAVRLDRQIGLEETPEDYAARLVEVFGEVRRVLRDDGTLWLIVGDSYYNYRPGAGQKLNKQTISGAKQDLPDICPRRGNKLNSLKEKDLIGIPWKLAFALRGDGWYLRQDIIWAKPNPMPESVKDRCTKSHEVIFLLSKRSRYYYDNEAIKEPAAEATIGRMKRGVSDKHKNVRGAPGQTPHTMNKPRLNMKNIQYDGQAANTFHLNRAEGGADKKYEKRNKRDVWTVSTKPYRGAHFAVFPVDLIEPCILAGCPAGGVVLDPFCGSGTVGVAAKRHGRNYIGIDLNSEYCEIARERILNS